MKTKSLYIMPVIVSIVFLLNFSVWAVPSLIDFQGKITDSHGNSLHGTFQMSFSLFNAETGGEAIWTEQKKVKIKNGICKVQLGSEESLTNDLFDNTFLYLEVEIAGSDSQWEKLSPRQRLTSTAFALKAGDSDMFGGQEPYHYAVASHVHDYKEIKGNISDEQVPDDITIKYAKTASSAANASYAEIASYALDSDYADESYYAKKANYADTAEYAYLSDESYYADVAEDSYALDGKNANEFINISTNNQTKQGGLNIKGNLGVGTTEPQGTLDVNGSIYQRGNELYADYVFEPAYDLESIEEHAAFMWNNRCLAAIPKSKLDKNGREVVDIGIYRKGIVEELEKAHIYIEQLHKRIVVLEEKLDKLEAFSNISK